MSNLASSLPSFSLLPIRLAIESAAGYLYGTLSKRNPLLMMSILAIRCVAETLFFRIANAFLDGKDLHSQKIYFATTCAVNVPFLIMMREKELMGRLPVAILGLGLLGILIVRVRYIQEQEEKKKNDKALDKTILDDTT